ncbi:MAG: helix-turn-helix domain-containing protein [Betaproteobacteria bacterium]|nr:helix-turn-helix domain-containing protein [Betaproteobacteria bacterium]
MKKTPEKRARKGIADPDAQQPHLTPPGITLEHHLGAEMRRRRLAQRLTIAEVAKKASISIGMLSKLENGQSSASLDTLTNLSRALGVSLSMLFQGYPPEEGGAQSVKRGRGMEVVRRGTKRGHTYHLLASDRGPRRVFEPFLVTLTDKSEVFQRFEHPGTEFLHILEGKIEYRHGKHSYMLGRGDSLTFKGEIPHGPERLIQLPIRMLSVIIYGRDDRDA